MLLSARTQRVGLSGPRPAAQASSRNCNRLVPFVQSGQHQGDAAASHASSAQESVNRQLGHADLTRVVSAFGAAVVCCTLVAGCQPAHAEDRAWKPRRHHRRMGEWYSNNWAQEVVQEQDAASEKQLAARRRHEQLLREQEEIEAARRRAEEAVRRKKAEAVLAQQAKETSRSDLPFSVKLGGQEVAPFIIWGGLGLLALGALKGTISAVGNARQRGEGKWVYDRSLGGKKVWVPAEGTTDPTRPTISDNDLQKLSSIAAAAASATTTAVAGAAGALELPSWWSPSPRIAVDPSLTAARQADAERLLGRMEAKRNRGEDFDIKDILKLREICQEGGVVVRPRTVGARDALFRTAVDAAVSVATDPAASYTYIGDVPPPRFLASLATDIDLPFDKAASLVGSTVAAAARARLLEALAAIKEDSGSKGESGSPNTGETTAVMNLVRLTSLLEKLPVLGQSGTEVALIAESLQRSFTVDERRRAFYLMGQLYPEAAALAAALLGFEPTAVVPQLMADMEEYRRQYEEAMKQQASTSP